MHTAHHVMLVTPIGHASYVGQDAYGKPTHAALHTHLGRLEYGHTRVVDATGIERVSRARVFFDATAIMDLKDLVVLPDTTRPPIRDLREIFDLDGSRSHWEIIF